MAGGGAVGAHLNAGALPDHLGRLVVEQLLEVLDEVGRLLRAQLRVGRAVRPPDGAIAPLDA
eukprot:2045786-Prymnesium_polylepis.1